MRLLTVGCSWTYGDELGNLGNIQEHRFSSILGRKLGADVVNLAKNGYSNHAIARIFLETDISEYDLVLVQMTHPSRTEWYDKEGKSKYHKRQLQKKLYPNVRYRKDPKIQSGWDSIMVDREHFMSTGNIMDGKEWWIRYYEELYHDKYGESDEMLFFHLIKNKLTNMSIPHIMMTINKKTKMPFDLQLNKFKYPRAKGNHPTSIGHIMIASDIMKLL